MSFDATLFKYSKPSPVATEYDDWTDEDLNELFGERAAIAEFDGGLPRNAAEKSALDWMKLEIGERRYRVWCSKPDEHTIKVAADPAKIDDRVNHYI